MKLHALLLLSAAFVLPAAGAADGHGAHGHAMPAAGQTEASWADGTVKKIDRAGGNVVIAHGPIDNIGMAAMTMSFRVKDGAWLKKMKEGARIRFVADYVDGAVVLTRWEPAR